MKTILVLVWAFALTMFPLAPVAEGQTPGAKPLVTVSGLPDSLPIGNRQRILDWAVTNRQWSLGGKPLTTFVSWSIESTSGVSYGRSTGELRLNSFKEFEDLSTQQFVEILAEMRASTEVGGNEDVSIYVQYFYSDWVADIPVAVLSLKKNLGPLSSVNEGDLRDLGVLFDQTVVRIPSLQRLEVSVGSDPAYYYSWPSTGNVSKSATSAFPKEVTPTSEFLSLRDWYCMGEYRARFSITAGGETGEYTQTGARLRPPIVRVLNDLKIEVTASEGSDTVIETSTNLVDWSVMTTLPWDVTSTVQMIPIYPPFNKFQFFRASSK